jgi:hypothetical protein
MRNRGPAVGFFDSASRGCARGATVQQDETGADLIFYKAFFTTGPVDRRCINQDFRIALPA